MDDLTPPPFATPEDLYRLYAAWSDRAIRRVTLEIALAQYPLPDGAADPWAMSAHVADLRRQHWWHYSEDVRLRARLDARLAQTPEAIVRRPAVQLLPLLPSGSSATLGGHLSRYLHVAACRAGRFAHLVVASALGARS